MTRKLNVNPALRLKERIVILAPKDIIYIRLTGDYPSHTYSETYAQLFYYVCRSKDFAEEMSNHHDVTPTLAIARLYKEGRMASLSICRDDPKETDESQLRMDVALALPFRIEAKGQIETTTIEGGKYVVYTYQGPYSGLACASDTIFHHLLAANNHRQDDRTPFCQYLNDPSRTKPDELLTDFYVPIL